MTDIQERFFWIDIETTGLDPYNELLLEVGFRITDVDLNLLAEHDWQLMEPYYDDKFQNLDDFILKMHTKSGLIEDCYDHGMPINKASADMTDWLREQGVTKSDPMCGSSVQFDRLFMGEHLPLVHDLFSYRNIDISTIKELCRRLNPAIYSRIDESTSKRELHRALPDLADTISEASFYFDNFLFLPGEV